MTSHFLSRLRDRVLSFLLVLCACCTLNALFSLEAAAALRPEQLAIVINDAEPNSVAVGEYYRKRRNIPKANVVHVSIAGKPQRISLERFRLLKEEIDGKIGPQVQAVLMIWTAPYAVECNSITGAYSLGFDASQCSKTCSAGTPSPYFNAKSKAPFTDHELRPSMLLPTESVAQAKALIDRGMAAGFRTLPASAYYLVNSESARYSRAGFLPPVGKVAALRLTL